MLLFLGEFERRGRGMLSARGAEARDRAGRRHGLCGVNAAAEFEFFVFDETPHSVREKGYRDLKKLTPGYFGYSVLRSSVHAEFYHELMKLCDCAMDFPLEGLHTETGPGVLEAAIEYTSAVARRRPGGAVQDVLQGACGAARLDGDLHGEVVARLAGAERAICTCRCNDKKGKSAFYDEKARAPYVGDDALVRRRAAEADAGIAGDDRVHRELATRDCPGLLGADGSRPGASRTGPGAARDSRQAGEEPARRVPDRGRRHQSLHRAGGARSARGFGGSRTRSSRTQPSRATPTRRNFRRSRLCRAR